MLEVVELIETSLSKPTQGMTNSIVRDSIFPEQRIEHHTKRKALLLAIQYLTKVL
jgi:hypothetical protein